jgi:hypothetical protein
MTGTAATIFTWVWIVVGILFGIACLLYILGSRRRA